MHPHAVNHIGVAAKSIREVLPFYVETLGLSLQRTNESASLGIKMAFLTAGDTLMELVEPTREGTPYAEFLRTQGEGLHHICLEVEDIDVAIADLGEKGVPLVGKEARQVSTGRTIVVDARGSHGVSIELLEMSPR